MTIGHPRGVDDIDGFDDMEDEEVGLDYDDDDDIIIGKHSLDDESIHIWLLIGN